MFASFLELVYAIFKNILNIITITVNRLSCQEIKNVKHSITRLDKSCVAKDTTLVYIMVGRIVPNRSLVDTSPDDLWKKNDKGAVKSFKKSEALNVFTNLYCILLCSKKDNNCNRKRHKADNSVIHTIGIPKYAYCIERKEFVNCEAVPAINN
jgi:hypothetical protein